MLKETQQAETDPAVIAFNEWKALEAESRRTDNETAYARAWAARLKLSDTVPTTLPGLLCMIRFSIVLAGEAGTSDPERVTDLADYEFGRWVDNLEGRFLRSLVTGAERLIGSES